jgi:hypothetical protein
MPVVIIAAATGLTAASNRNLATILGANAPITGWVTGLILQSPDTNTDANGGIKVGNSAMTSSNFDAQIHPGDSDSDSADTSSEVMLNSRYVRTDESADQTLIIRFEST